MTEKSIPTPPTSKVQKLYLEWYEDEKAKGLKDIKFFPGDVSQATVDAFIAESKLIDQAIDDKRCSPLPDSL